MKSGERHAIPRGSCSCCACIPCGSTSDNVSLGESFEERRSGQFDVVINNAVGAIFLGRASCSSAEAVHAPLQAPVFAHIELCRSPGLDARPWPRAHHQCDVAVSRLPVPFMGHTTRRKR